ncbi:MAG: HAMP domain-containing histidine kinase [Rubripirellula sp.]|nr:HAMP domain-containing histidine kinase [Rubripirellula sp.]
MGLLPCLRRGSERWWLPQTERSTEAISHLLLMDRRNSSGNNPSLDGATRDRVCRALQSDPSYFVYAALTYTGSGPVELDELATWHAHNITEQLASGDAYLGAPKITTNIEKRWRKLTDHFRTIPTSRWMEDAHLWLEVTGPQVSNTWREQWPTVRSDPNTLTATTPNNNHSVLQEFARSVQHQKFLESAFDFRLRGEKLAAIKQLAYGLSHEINNPLANISTRAEQLQRGESDPNRSATLQRIIDQVYRAHEMIADLMFYANPPELERQACLPRDLLAEVTETFKEESERQGIQLQISNDNSDTFHPEREIRADATMLKEAIRVLIRNAIDAIGCQGTIVLSLQFDLECITITVADSGPGLSEQARKHAFDPYFSGREAGRGMGLGLCRAYRIAQLHEGDISLASGPSGCVATLTLPAKLTV